MVQQSKEQTSGFRTVLYLLGIMIVTALAVVLQLRFRGFEGPLSDNLLIIFLINANFLLLAAVVVMIARSLWKLSIERRQKVLGARFRTKLVVAFVSLSFIPPVLLFIIGTGMFTRSIERIFNLQVENSLRDSVEVARASYERIESEARLFGRQISREITEQGIVRDEESIRRLFSLRAGEYHLNALEFYSSPYVRGTTVLAGSLVAGIFTPTPPDVIDAVFRGRENAAVIDLEKQGEIVRAVVPVYPARGDRRVVGVVSVNYHIPESLASRTSEINRAFAHYRASASGKAPIKLSYRLGFLAVALSLLLAAIWVALRVASGITVPIQKLAEGTAAVAAGRFDYHIDESSGDEVGLLVDSFNTMTGELRHSRELLEREIAYKETILSNINTGVISMDPEGTITTINRAACRILGISESETIGRRYDEAFGFIELGPIRRLFRKPEQGQADAEEELRVTVRGGVMTLRTRVSTLRDAGGAPAGSVITFDDLTELLKAKKAETWQDVARRIAHEFKNPLTPIKLSAERLRKKYAEGASDFDRVFNESSKTIIQEAEELRKLVDEFANFARMPTAVPARQPLHPVLEEVIQLYAGAHRGIRFESRFSPDVTEALLDRDQIRRVFINLFENSVEALGGSGTITVTTGFNGTGRIRVDVADDGPGIAADDVPRLFQPDFSRKKKNSGLGLAIVHKIVTDHNGTIRFEQNPPRGARFIVELAPAIG